MTQGSGTSVFFNEQEEGFGKAVPEDERLHRSYQQEITAADLVETQFFGFNVPEANVHALTYLWAHPNMNLLSSGAWVWQGIKVDTLQSELFDVRDFIPDAPITVDGDLDGFVLPNGYGVEVLEPLRKIRISYEDRDRDNSFDVTGTAVMPPAMVASGKHFDQAMKMEGHVRLRGRDHVIDGYHVRDRSWGETRPETPRLAPPLYWSSPVFGDDFALNVTGIDDPTQDPVWKGLYDFGPEQVDAFNRGWVWRDGELYGVAKVSIRTQWDRATGYPIAQLIDLTDTGGREFTITGTVTAASNWHIWSNVRAGVCLARWECEGRIGWGDLQPVAWTDFIHHLMG